jgi:hypothetical protein
MSGPLRGEQTTVTTGCERVVWFTDTGYRCAIRPYDDTRYQLRLTWCDGTIKSDLFDSSERALSAAFAWKSEIEKKELNGP